MKRKSPCSKLPAEVRFWKKVDKQDGGCWLWTGALVRKGYGRFNEYPSGVAAHRYSWMQANGPIPDGMFVCHRCDNPRCVNPEHLFLGTPKENTQDMLAKGRHSHGLRHGESIKASDKKRRKLNREVIAGIKRELSAGTPQRTIAKAYGVCQRTVSVIKQGLSWSEANA